MKHSALSFIMAIACVALAVAGPSAGQFRPPGVVQVQNRFGKLRPPVFSKAPQVSGRRHQLPPHPESSGRQPSARKLNNFEYLAASLPKLWQQRIGKGAFKLIPTRFTSAENRRRTLNPNAPPFVYKKAEEIAGYQRFTLDEAVVPDKPRARSDDFIESDEETTLAPTTETETELPVELSTKVTNSLDTSTTEAPTLSP